MPHTRRPRAHHSVNPYLGARRQNETNFFSDQDETNPSISTVHLCRQASYLTTLDVVGQ